ncbi:antitoxin HicB [Devosia enhydra]|uniref:Antitoxin HicB n=1 Tax=Devosia enhydra TaxID=665118 RepID=A0A1K2I2J4_9HYPH|nr:type II toxin-antitoxin system HicB family antitoxin [Devosia enhydra]SFZ86443.1 antitoxin HicB [Devosia enhydra]
MRFLARLVSDDGGLLVTFPDLPEAVTGGANLDEALNNAAEALDLTVLNYVVDRRPLPAPSSRPLQDGTLRWIDVSASAMAKIAFIEAFQASGMTRVGLAARLGASENEVRRMLNPNYPSKLTTLETGLRALGKRFVISTEAAA